MGIENLRIDIKTAVAAGASFVILMIPAIGFAYTIGAEVSSNSATILELKQADREADIRIRTCEISNAAIQAQLEAIARAVGAPVVEGEK